MTGIESFVYRNRAGGARQVAAVTVDGVNRRLLLEIAHDYEEIAEIVERIAAIDALVRKRQTRSNTTETDYITE